MYARLTHSNVHLDKIDEAVEASKKALDELISLQPGFKTAFTLFDRETGKGTTITVWETEAHRASTGADPEYNREVATRMGPFMTSLPTNENLEIELYG